MDRVTPLFILGMGRSGTTNALRAFNTHPSVMLNGEISLPVLKQFLELLETVERSYDKKDTARDGWFERKADYMFSSFGYLAKGGRGRLDKRGHATFLGHKTPRLETLFDAYEAHFGSAGLKPRYIYCARNAFDCWRSYKSMEWNGYDTVDRFLEHYSASYEKLEDMRSTAGGRVCVLNLDALVAAGDPIGFYRENLFAPLDLELPERALPRIARIHKGKRSGPESRALSDEDRETIRRHPGMRRLYDEMFAPYVKSSHY